MNSDNPSSTKPRFAAAENSNKVVYLLRTMQQHHVSLSAMADQKAGMVLAATSVMLTIIMTQLNGDASLPLTLMVLGVTALVSAIFAVMAVMPRIDPKMFADSGRNLLFFGNFAHMKFDEFLDHIAPAINQNEELITAMLRDSYQLGLVLHRKKYRFLQISYRTLLLGLVATVVCGALEYMLLPPAI